MFDILKSELSKLTLTHNLMFNTFLT